MHARGATLVALFTALLTAFALGLQLSLVIERMTGEGASVGAAVWRYFGFFTILSNVGVAVVAGAMAGWPTTALAGPRARLATATAIALVGLVYSIALRDLWSPTGWQAIADHALHDVTPPLFLLAWLLADHGWLDRRDAAWALAPPLAYCAYALARGRLDGWYAYWFLDPTNLTIGQLAISVAVLSAAFLAVAGFLVACDAWIARRVTSR